MTLEAVLIVTGLILPNPLYELIEHRVLLFGGRELVGFPGPTFTVLHAHVHARIQKPQRCFQRTAGAL
jgi:hypothetical protein